MLFVPAKEVLVDFPVFHDDQEIPGGILDEFDVLQRVAVHQQQIGERAFFHDTELAGIGIDVPAQANRLQSPTKSVTTASDHSARRIVLTASGDAQQFFALIGYASFSELQN